MQEVYASDRQQRATGCDPRFEQFHSILEGVGISPIREHKHVVPAQVGAHEVVGVEVGSPQAKDVVEHKLGNAAIIVALRFLSAKKRSELRRILSSERISHKMVTRARAIVSETPAETDCRQIAVRYMEEAKKHLTALKESSYRQELSRLAEEIVARSY